MTGGVSPIPLARQSGWYESEGKWLCSDCVPDRDEKMASDAIEGVATEVERYMGWDYLHYNYLHYKGVADDIKKRVVELVRAVRREYEEE